MEHGTVFDLKRFAVHDGPGIRTTVFLKGCPLHCVWCHNPESQRSCPELSFTASRCVGCARCAAVCPNDAIRIDGWERSRCTGCGSCAAVCYHQARELLGRTMTVAEVMAEVRKDQTFFAVSGGGMTLSGGEPMSQFIFSKALLTAAKVDHINTALETCGYAPPEHFFATLPLVNLYLFDLKESNPLRHVTYTGIELKPILHNLELLAQNQATIILRCPLIPGCNDRPDHFASIARLAERWPAIRGIEVEPYNPLGNAKRQALGRSPDMIGCDVPPDDTIVNGWLQTIQSATAKPVTLT